jgi:hypothetical protein
MDELKKAAATGAAAQGNSDTVNAGGPNTASVNCEQCRQPMTLKFTTLRLTESGRVRVYECVDCERLAFIPAPPVVPQAG